MYTLYKKVSTQNERFLCKITHVHALIIMFPTLFSNPTTTIHHNSGANNSTSEPVDLPGQLRLPLASVQQERDQGWNIWKLEASHGNWHWAFWIRKSYKVWGLSGKGKLIVGWRIINIKLGGGPTYFMVKSTNSWDFKIEILYLNFVLCAWCNKLIDVSN